MRCIRSDVTVSRRTRRKRFFSSHPIRRASSPASCCRLTAASWPAGSNHRHHSHSTSNKRCGQRLATVAGASANTSRTDQTKGKDSMYYQVISQCVDMLKNLESWLDKAEEHAAAKKFDVGVLMAGRLAPDMKPFIYQVQSACDYVKAGAAWLSGQTPPRHEDNEHTIDEVRARIRKTVDFAESVKEAQYAGASERKVSMSWAPAGKVLGG